MENCIKLSGTILFDPKNITNKQDRQSNWKKVAMVILESDLNYEDNGISDYYAWFINKRYNLPLQRPLRRAHVTIINDKISEMNGKWEEVKSMWHGKNIDVILNVDPLLGIENRKGNYTDWWLTIPYEYREEFHSIRRELGLCEKPFFGLHMTIGSAINFYPKHEDYSNTEKALGMFENHSEYILKIEQKRNIELKQ